MAASIRGSEQERSQIVRGCKARIARVRNWRGRHRLVHQGDRSRGTLVGNVGHCAFYPVFTALIALCLRPGITQRIFQTPSLRWLGKISYGIYVYHLLLAPLYAWLTRQIFLA